MPDSPLPEDDNFARHCSGKAGKHFSDEEDGYREPPWLHGIAFQPTAENPHLSGLWVEAEPGTWEVQLNRIRKELKESKRKPGKNHSYAIIQVAKIKALGRRHSRTLHVLHIPDQDAGLPSHAEIRGVRPEDEILQQRLADVAVIEPIFNGT